MKEQYIKKKKKKALGRPRLQYLKQVTRYTGTDNYTPMRKMACNNSRWKAANQSKGYEEDLLIYNLGTRG
jgi:hypothetical protein